MARFATPKHGARSLSPAARITLSSVKDVHPSVKGCHEANGAEKIVQPERTGARWRRKNSTVGSKQQQQQHQHTHKKRSERWG